MARAILCALFSLLSAISSGCVIENHKNVKMLLKTIENSEKDRIYSYSTSTCRNCYRNFLGFFVHVFSLFPFPFLLHCRCMVFYFNHTVFSMTFTVLSSNCMLVSSVQFRKGITLEWWKYSGNEEDIHIHPMFHCGQRKSNVNRFQSDFYMFHTFHDSFIFPTKWRGPFWYEPAFVYHPDMVSRFDMGSYQTHIKTVPAPVNGCVDQSVYR